MHAGDWRYPAKVNEPPSVRTAPQCTVETNTNMAGFTIRVEGSAKSVDECCAACKEFQRCAFWVWANATCSLKSSDAGRTEDRGATSGSSKAPPSPGSHGTRISAIATASRSRGSHGISVFLSYWSDTGNETDRDACVSFTGDRHDGGTVTEYRIDKDHANAYPVWQKMGSPPRPTDAQVKALVEASKVVPVQRKPNPDGSVCVTMPANSAIVLSF